MNQLGLFYPDTTWVPPQGPLPDLRGEAMVAVDLETRDDGLAKELGPGWAYGWGHIAGVAVARQDWSRYYPVRHPDTDCRPLEDIVAWLRDLFNSSTPIVFHNAAYDLGWLRASGLRAFPNVFHDTHAMAVMLDENRMSYTLDAISSWNGIPGKDKQLLTDAAAAFGCRKPTEMGNYIWQMPARFIGDYAEADALATVRNANIMLPKIHEQGIRVAYELERDIIPMCVEMRERGIRISTDKIEEAQFQLRNKLKVGLDELSRNTGRRVDVHTILSPDALAPMFDAEGLEYPRTPKTLKGSFKSDWLKDHPHWLPKSVAQLRQLDQMAEKFLGTYLMEFQHRGRIHAEIHQLRDDNGGTRSYRFSYANPPLQQMPARDPEMAPLIRGVFLPEEGEFWAANDYSQQEPRLATHFASLTGMAGAEEAVAYYMNDPKADFHQMVAEMAGIDRKQAKIINLGIMYGMGRAKLARALGLTLEEADVLLETYNMRLPWVGGLSDLCARRASTRGCIKLLDGALCRFDLYEPSWRKSDGGEWIPAMPLDRAALQWPRARLVRAFTHKAMNRLIQGSAARQTKMAMRELYRLRMLPLIQMHDELGSSVQDETQARQIAEVMCNVVQLRVPVNVDTAIGETWGLAA